MHIISRQLFSEFSPAIRQKSNDILGPMSIQYVAKTFVKEDSEQIVKELYEKMELLKVSPQDRLIVVYEFFIKYFREKDMKEFECTEYFFVDGFNMITHSDFLKNKFYRTLMSKITNFKMPSQERIPGTLRQYLDSTSGKNNKIKL